MARKVNLHKALRLAARKQQQAERRRRVATMAAVWAVGTRPGKGGGRDFQGFTAQRQFSSAHVG